jgi:NADPH2:quinone reductase
MKAIQVHQFGGPEVLKFEEVPEPKPAAGEVLVRLRAIGVNAADTYVRSGGYAANLTPPFIPGTDGAGVIAEVGSGVAEFQPGERVFITGTASGIHTGAYAELAVCQPSQIHRLPDKVSFAQGATIGVPCATAYRALFQKAQARAGKTVLVHGASGGVGIAAVQLARAAGLHVIGTAGSERGRKLVAEQGAHRVLDHHAANYLDGIRPDVILEMLANVNLARDLEVVAPRGCVVVIGNRGNSEINPRAAMQREATIFGMLLTNATSSERAEIYAALVAGLESGALRPVIGRELPLAEVARAHELMLQPGAGGKIVLIP